MGVGTDPTERPAGIPQFPREVFNPLSGKPSHLVTLGIPAGEYIPIENWEAETLNRIQSSGANANPISNIGISRRHPPVGPEGGTPTPRAKQCCVRDSL